MRGMKIFNVAQMNRVYRSCYKNTSHFRSHSCVCMFTLQIPPKMTKSRMGQDSGGGAFLLHGNDKVFTLDLLSCHC